MVWMLGIWKQHPFPFTTSWITFVLWLREILSLQKNTEISIPSGWSNFIFSPHPLPRRRAPWLHKCEKHYKDWNRTTTEVPECPIQQDSLNIFRRKHSSNLEDKCLIFNLTLYWKMALPSENCILSWNAPECHWESVVDQHGGALWPQPPSTGLLPGPCLAAACHRIIE